MQRLSREAIYEAAYDDEVFQALPDLIRQAHDARSVVMHFVDAGGLHLSMAHTGQWSDDQVALYGSLAEKDILQQATAQMGRMNRFWNITDDLVSPLRLKNSEIYSRFYRPIGDDTRHVLGVSFQTPWGVGAIGVHRGDHTSAFGQADVDALQDVAVDLRRMLTIRSRLMLSAQREAQAKAVLDRFSLAIFQVDAEARIHDANAQARQLIDWAGAGLVRGGVLQLEEPDMGPLRWAIRRATRARAPEANMVRLAAGQFAGWTLTVTPMPTMGGARALVLVKSLTAEQDLAQRLQALFGLSLAEALVAIALSQGEATRDIAVARGVTEHTVRSQIKSLMAKTGCRRQGQLVSLIASLPPVAFR